MEMHGMEMPKLKPLLSILETLVGGMKAALIGTALADTERYAISSFCSSFCIALLHALSPQTISSAPFWMLFVLEETRLSDALPAVLQPVLENLSQSKKAALLQLFRCFNGCQLLTASFQQPVSVSQAREEISVDELRFLATGSNLVACMARLTHEQY